MSNKYYLLTYLLTYTDNSVNSLHSQMKQVVATKDYFALIT